MPAPIKKIVTRDLKWKNLEFDEHFHADLAIPWCHNGADWFKLKTERNSCPALHQRDQPFGKYHIVDFASNLFRNFNLILKRGEVKIPSSMLHHVFSMWFSTIVECFSIIKFWLLCVKEKLENIKLCMWLRKCWNFRRMGMKYCFILQESRFWWAFSCRSRNSLMPQWCWLIQIEERNS